METIVVATDLSIRSERAVRRAFALAQEIEARLHVVHVIDSALPNDIACQMQTAARDNLQRFCAAAGSAAFETHAEVADPILRIESLCSELGADLLVLGVHRKRVFGDLFSNTTMERLVRAAARPVLLVNDPVDHDYRRVLLGTDLSEACARAARSAAELAPLATITGFHAVHIPFRGFTAGDGSAAGVKPFLDQAANALDAWIARTELPASFQRPEVVAADLTATLYQALKTTRPDLLALGAHGRPGFLPSLLGSFTQDLIRNPPCDMLVVR